MRAVLFLLCLFFTTAAQSQYKDGISIVQFSAEFVKSSELDLKPFKQHNTYTYYLGRNEKIFKAEGVKYLPTIILFHNGEEIFRVTSGISLELPENATDKINEHIEELLDNKF